MTLPAHVATSRAIASIKAALTLVDAQIQLAPSPPAISKHASPGEILAAMSNRPAYAPSLVRKHLVATRKRFVSSAKQASEMVDTVGLVADALSDAAAYLRGRRQALPDTVTARLPSDVVRALGVVRRAASAGIDVPVSALADSLEADSMSVSLKLVEARETLARVKSAGDVAVYSQSTKKLTALSNDPGYTREEQKRLARDRDSYDLVTKKLKGEHRRKHLVTSVDRLPAKTVEEAAARQLRSA